MSPPPSFLIRADAGGSLGSGHIMRMIALGQAVVDRGGAVTIASGGCPDAIAERISQESINFKALPTATLGSPVDLQATIKAAKESGATWIVLDGYHFGTDFQKGLRQAGFKVLSMDDYGHCQIWAADAVLNQNIFAPELQYASEVASSRFLLGTRFALLRREFRIEAESWSANPVGRSCRSAHNHGGAATPPFGSDEGEGGDSGQRSNSIRRLLLTLGGVDADNVSGRILAALNLIDGEPLQVKVLVGPGNPHIEHLRTAAASSRHAVEILSNVTDMPPLYRWAQGVISAGGSTCWEWMFYRLPAAVVCLADNQKPVIASLVKHGLALDLGWHSALDVQATAARLKSWLEDNPTFPAIPERIAVDGLGAMRVAALLDQTNVWIRRARETDAQLWFSWANDALVRANGFHPEPIPWEDHLAWFEKHRRSPDSRLWIGFDLNDVPAGYVRLHKRGLAEWEIGIAVAPEKRGQGVGQQLVQLALQEFSRTFPRPSDQSGNWDSVAILAQVKPANAASLKLFRALEFVEDTERTSPGCCVLVRKLRI